MFPVPALTAEQVLGETLELKAGDRLLVNGAGGVTAGCSSVGRSAERKYSHGRSRSTNASQHLRTSGL